MQKAEEDLVACIDTSMFDLEPVSAYARAVAVAVLKASGCHDMVPPYDCSSPTHGDIPICKRCEMLAELGGAE